MAHFFYANYLVSCGDVRAALPEYRQAKAMLPDDPMIQFHLGLPRFAMHDFDGALKEFRAALELEPQHTGGNYWIGRIYEEQGRFDEAIAEFARYDRMALQSEDSVFYAELRQAARDGGAQGYWQKRLERELQSPHLDAYNIAKFLVRLHREEEAYARLEESYRNGQIDIGNLVFDLCWDYTNPQFQAIARKVGLKL